MTPVPSNATHHSAHTRALIQLSVSQAVVSIVSPSLHLFTSSSALLSDFFLTSPHSPIPLSNNKQQLTS